jgi:coenzyme PQQ synthesis protein D (PqqD)
MLRPTLPLARTEELVVQELGSEVLIYDRRTDLAHCLTSVAALVWQACDGTSTTEEVVERLRQSGEADAENLLVSALDELESKDLLETVAPSGGISRRHAIRKLAGVGMVAVAAPLVISASVTTPEAAASGGVLAKYAACTASTQCANGLTCQSGHCYNTGQTCFAGGTRPNGAQCGPTNQGVCCSGACGTGNNCAA